MTRLNYILSLAWKSAWNRRGTLLLIVLSIALSTALLLGIERLRAQMKDNFVQSVSGTDLIVGARGSGIQLLLYAIFHLGGATNNMGWDSAQAIEKRPQVAWTIPLSLGDTHNDYPVVATTDSLYEHYQFRNGQKLTFAQGKKPEALFDVVLGAEAARNLGYALGRRIALTHGRSGGRVTEHSDMPFTVCGILAPTGTPVDRSLFINLHAMEAIHVNWQGGVPTSASHLTAEEVASRHLEPKAITALLVGLKRRSQIFALQRDINEWKEEALMGVLPGVALDQIWNMIQVGENAFLLVSALVTFVGLVGLVTAILAGLGERRRELAILRSAGARPMDILLLMAFEGGLLVISGVIMGILLLCGLTLALTPLIADKYGFFLSLSAPSLGEWFLLAGICAAGIGASLIPAIKAYRMSLADGLAVSI